MGKRKREVQRLNQKFVNGATYRFGPNSRSADWRWDDKIAGYGLRIYPSGRKVFVLDYRTTQDRRGRMVLGKHPNLSAEAARAEAERILRTVEDGADPIEGKKAESEAKTISGLVERFLADHAAKQPSFAASKSRLNKHVVPVWGTRKANTITSGDVTKLHGAVAEKTSKSTANRVLTVISKMFSLAELWGDIDQGTNPARGVTKYSERDRIRSRWAKPEDELPKILVAISNEHTRLGEHSISTQILVELDKTPGLTCSEISRKVGKPAANVWNLLSNLQDQGRVARRYEAYFPIRSVLEDDIIVRAAFLLLISTGMRRGEALSSRWSNLDRSQSSLFLPTSKSNKARSVPLSGFASAVVDTLPRDGGDFLFPGRKNNPHLTNITKAWNRIRQRAGSPDLRVHDLRRTFATLAIRAGWSQDMVGRVLGHANSAMTARYIDVPSAPLKALAEDVGQVLTDVAQKALGLPKPPKLDADDQAELSEPEKRAAEEKARRELTKTVVRALLGVERPGLVLIDGGGKDEAVPTVRRRLKR